MDIYRRRNEHRRYHQHRLVSFVSSSPPPFLPLSSGQSLSASWPRSFLVLLLLLLLILLLLLHSWREGGGAYIIAAAKSYGIGFFFFSFHGEARHGYGMVWYGLCYMVHFL